MKWTCGVCGTSIDVGDSEDQILDTLRRATLARLIKEHEAKHEE